MSSFPNRAKLVSVDPSLRNGIDCRREVRRGGLRAPDHRRRAIRRSRVRCVGASRPDRARVVRLHTGALLDANRGWREDALTTRRALQRGRESDSRRRALPPNPGDVGRCSDAHSERVSQSGGRCLFTALGDR